METIVREPVEALRAVTELANCAKRVTWCRAVRYPVPRINNYLNYRHSVCVTFISSNFVESNRATRTAETPWWLLCIVYDDVVRWH